MKNQLRKWIGSLLAGLLVMSAIPIGYTEPAQTTNGQSQGGGYSLEQAMSDNAQLSTIAFSGLAFITGSAGADSFMPPGKVADFFGFQYMRDVDVAGYGHNTTFLSKAANNVLYILNDEQKESLVQLAKAQAPLYTQFAYNRFPLMNAFRRNLEGDIPSSSSGLDLNAVADYTASLYKTDADLSYNRAVVVGQIIDSFDENQKAYLEKMQFNDYNSWNDVAEDETLKKSLTNTEFVAVMTYASELFSWYKGTLESDVYFCPERHGTYFGGFYMKDYPAMNNPDYFISTAVTGDKGKEFLNILNDEQRQLITSIIPEQKDWLLEVADLRTKISTELRKAMTGGSVDKAEIYEMIQRYGELDGKMSGLYASRFAAVNRSLTEQQRAELVALRDLEVVPKGAYLYSTAVDMPSFSNTDYFFGVGNLPSSAGQVLAPATFLDKGNTNPVQTKGPEDKKNAQGKEDKSKTAKTEKDKSKQDKSAKNEGSKQPKAGKDNTNKQNNVAKNDKNKQSKPPKNDKSQEGSQPQMNGGFDGTIVLGQPTQSSINASIVSNEDMSVYITYGAKSGQLNQKSKVVKTVAGQPTVIQMSGLKANQQYYYKLYFKGAKDKQYQSTPEYHFNTAKTGSTAYTFAVQSDSHLLNKADKSLYAQSMENISEMNPDFMFDLGDTFLNDQIDNPNDQNYNSIQKHVTDQLPYFDIATRTVPLFLTIGNHEGEYGFFLKGSSPNLAEMSTKARTTYFPNPVPNQFYSGNIEKESELGQPENYYAFTWGDALYVSIDPYRYSTNDPYNDKDGWQWSLGKTQYDWFKKTLENSDAKYKFVFAHHAIGNVRGGASIAKLYEWGGYDKNGKYLFDEKRPGWGKPIQQIMKDENVTIFFQGHDHLFAREVVDGVVYQTLPKPAEKIADNQSNEKSYPNGDKMMNSGILKVDVSASQVQVNYYRNYYVSSGSQVENTGIVYSYTVNSKHQVKVLKGQDEDFSTYGENAKTDSSSAKVDKVTQPVEVEGNGSVSGVLLGAPENSAITLKAIAYEPVDAYVTYGLKGSNATAKTQIRHFEKGAIMEWTLTQLKPSETYQYALNYKTEAQGKEQKAQSGSFSTAKLSGESFVFTIQADSHRDEASDLNLYRQTLSNVLKDKPDFHIDLGDTFMAEKLGQSQAGTLTRYLDDRSYFESIGYQVPLLLVNGNHEGEVGWATSEKDEAVAKWASEYRMKYFVNPEMGSFYSGVVANQGNYYAFQWGDALFVVLDPYTFSEKKAQSDTDGWSYTLGKTQYDWLVKTLSESHAKSKFIFTHNLVGGLGKDARGGAEASAFFEWGGLNADGTQGFEKMRPGWEKPIHEVLKENNVTAVFHGHDHFFAKQSRDGILYQLVPQPSHPGSSVQNAAAYGYKTGVFLPPAGHLRIKVSSGKVTIEYVKASLTPSENGKVVDRNLLTVSQ